MNFFCFVLSCLAVFNAVRYIIGLGRSCSHVFNNKWLGLCGADPDVQLNQIRRKSACTRENSLSNLITIDHGRNLTFPYWIITSFSEQSTSLSCLGTCVRQICNSIDSVFFSTGKNDRLRYNNNLDKLFSFILNLPRSVQLECQHRKKY